MRAISQAIERWSAGRLSALEVHNCSQEVVRVVEDTLRKHLRNPVGVTGVVAEAGPGVTGPGMDYFQAQLVHDIMRELD